MSDSKRKRETLPVWHIPLAKIIELTAGEREMLRLHYMSHGRLLADGIIEVSGYMVLGQQRMMWHVYRGKGADPKDWHHV